MQYIQYDTKNTERTGINQSCRWARPFRAEFVSTSWAIPGFPSVFHIPVIPTSGLCVV